MATIRQILPYSHSDALTPLEQVAESAVATGGALYEISANAFVWGHVYPYSEPGEYYIDNGSIIFEGVGFTYDGGDLPASGIITSISINRYSEITDETVIVPDLKLEFTDLAIDLSEMGDEVLAALTGDIAPLYNYFLDLQWAFQGNDSGTYEDLFEGGNLDDIIDGNGGNATLYGLGGDDVLRVNDASYGYLYGGDGDDVLIVKGGLRNLLNGGAGADTLIGGGSKEDRADYSDSAVGLTVSLATPSINTGDAAGDVYQSIEIIAGSAFNDRLIGDGNANSLIGGDGDDVLIGGAGRDGLGGGNGIDTADYSGSASGLVVSLANPQYNTGDAQGDTFSSIEVLIGSNFIDELYGTNGADTIKSLGGDDAIKGYGGDDTLEGGDGNDWFDGGTGADSMVGGLGDDVFIVDDVGDQVSEFDSQGTDNIEASVSYSLGGIHVDNLYLTGSAEINGTGNSLNNVVKGNSGRNNLDGSGGTDKINGAGGADILTGGTGPDQFIYSNLSDSTADTSGRDTILDFAKGQDRVNLSPIDANTKTSGDQAFTFIGGAAYSNKAGELRYGINGDQTIISGDVNGDGVTDFKIVLSGSISLGSADFVL